MTSWNRREEAAGCSTASRRGSRRCVVVGGAGPGGDLDPRRGGVLQPVVLTPNAEGADMDGLRAREIQTLFRWFKEGPPGAVPIEHDQRSVGLLQAATWEDAAGRPAERLAAWHGSASARQWLV